MLNLKLIYSNILNKMKENNKRKYVVIIMIIFFVLFLGYLFLKDFVIKENIREKELLELREEVEHFKWANKRLEQTIEDTPRDFELLEKVILEKHGDKKLNEETIGFENERELD